MLAQPVVTVKAPETVTTGVLINIAAAARRRRADAHNGSFIEGLAAPRCWKDQTECRNRSVNDFEGLKSLKIPILSFVTTLQHRQMPLGAAMAKAVSRDLHLLDEGVVNLRRRPAQLHIPDRTTSG
jgi:hypothetical protein